jgi:hypothetical protein
VVQGQTGIEVFVFDLQVQQGTQSVAVTQLAFHARDQNGDDVPMDSAFLNLNLEDAAQTIVLPVSSDGSAFATFGGAVTASVSVLPVTLTADIAPSVSAKSVQLSVDGAGSLKGENIALLSSVGFTTSGDPTGFPMVSGLMVFSDGNLADTFGNYPNPFHAGSEDTTIEFYLATAAGSASVEIYDVMGNRVVSLPDTGSLVGLQKILWDGKNGLGHLVSNGVYFAQLTVDGSKVDKLVKVAVAK